MAGIDLSFLGLAASVYPALHPVYRVPVQRFLSGQRVRFVHAVAAGQDLLRFGYFCATHPARTTEVGQGRVAEILGDVLGLLYQHCTSLHLHDQPQPTHAVLRCAASADLCGCEVDDNRGYRCNATPPEDKIGASGVRRRALQRRGFAAFLRYLPLRVRRVRRASSKREWLNHTCFERRFRRWRRRGRVAGRRDRPFALRQSALFSRRVYSRVARGLRYVSHLPKPERRRAPEVVDRSAVVSLNDQRYRARLGICFV